MFVLLRTQEPRVANEPRVALGSRVRGNTGRSEGHGCH
ncbi:hypothetical protein FHY05_002479 [Sphingomonas sp. BK580]|nr:hypothetical protein [Sphingomonas sp. BK580]